MSIERTQIVGVQMDIAWEDRTANHRRVSELLEVAKPAAGALVALPEMFASGFSMNAAKIAEDSSRQTEQFLEATSKRFGITLVGGLVTCQDSGRLAHNEAVAVASAGKPLARYQKIHPFLKTLEGAHYQAGSAVKTFSWAGATVAPAICYDLRFPEVFRAAMARGAEVFVVIANWPSTRAEHWITLLRARAIENQAYVLGVNRCGHDPNHAYPGRSLIIDYRGEVLADAGAHEGVIQADVDLPGLRAYRRELPFLSDVRCALGKLFE